MSAAAKSAGPALGRLTPALVPVVTPRHTTFYRRTGIYVREPGGNSVGFAQFEA